MRYIYKCTKFFFLCISSQRYRFIFISILISLDLDHLRCELTECFFFFFFTTQYIYTIYSLLVLVHLRHVLAHHDIPLSWPFVVIDARAAGRSESRQVASRRADPRPKGGLCDCLAPT